ncbi:flagellar basal body P-ring formation chaperone FlgA [Tropicimonas sp. IMCC6043]|uniref:flagellar basal body P-ring formation chaperone FlgA n=1 Tax=Tropicimonas sp. IMCC6043 TaxID=2510645 RepID=UPI00101D99D8|nr:flagellar basal body P-ring formation chaperone FlgA [Tropicimonas sp. IMCC6043]RYH07486.1 flagellar basal body P-ring formation protein FlgA [Tropicimonas sp. IMCC6043]
MRRIILLPILLPALAGMASAEALVASHTIRSRTLVTAEDVQLVAEDLPGALTDPAAAIGMEARVVLYAGRAISAEDLQPPARIERNQIVPLVFDSGTLAISTDGRSLSRAAVGERVRVMNLQSRSTVTGTVDPLGRVIVDPSVATFTNTEIK